MGPTMANDTEKLPSFVCVGGAKCGTTSLYEYLRCHPKIFLPLQKELHFFSYPDLRFRTQGPGMHSVLKDLISSENQYRAQFSTMKPGMVGGDISPSYLNAPGAPDNIKALLGQNTKIIILLRNPVDRVISQYMHLRRAAREDLSLDEALEQESNRKKNNWGDMWLYKDSALAADRVRKYIETFGQNNVLILLSDQLREDPTSAVKEVCQFIGVSPKFEFNAAREFNKSGSPKSRILARLVDASPLASLAKSILPRRVGTIIKRKLQELNTGEKEPIPEHIKTQLLDYYSTEIDKIEEIICRKTGWKDYRIDKLRNH